MDKFNNKNRGVSLQSAATLAKDQMEQHSSEGLPKNVRGGNCVLY